MPGHDDLKFRTIGSPILMAPIFCRMSPYGEPFYDGISLEAMEVMFVKVKERFLEMKWSYAMHAQHYDKWSTAASQASVMVSSLLKVMNFVRALLAFCLTKA